MPLNIARAGALGALTALIAGAACRQAGKAPETYLDPELPAHQRVELLLEQMTLEEKIGQMCSYVGEAAAAPGANTDEQTPYVEGLGETAELVKQGKIGSFRARSAPSSRSPTSTRPTPCSGWPKNRG